jgi:hypothetical protein
MTTVTFTLAEAAAVSPLAGSGSVDEDCCPWPRPSAVEADDIAGPSFVRARTKDWCPVDMVDEWGVQSFPASDPPANW